MKPQDLLRCSHFPVCRSYWIYSPKHQHCPRCFSFCHLRYGSDPSAFKDTEVFLQLDSCTERSCFNYNLETRVPLYLLPVINLSILFLTFKVLDCSSRLLCSDKSFQCNNMNNLYQPSTSQNTQSQRAWQFEERLCRLSSNLPTLILQTNSPGLCCVFLTGFGSIKLNKSACFTYPWLNKAGRCASISDFVVKCIGEESKYEGIQLLFDSFQQPLLNKQVNSRSPNPRFSSAFTRASCMFRQVQR